MPVYVQDLPEGVGRYSAGAATPPVQVPTVAAARATGLPVEALFQPAAAVARPAVAILPPTLLERALDIGARAKSGMQRMLGIVADKEGNAPTAKPLTTVTAHEQALDELEKRSSPTVFQMRQKAAATPVKY